MLSDGCLSCSACPVCLSVYPSVTLVYCGQMVGWIERKLGMGCILGPGHNCVRWGPIAPLPNGRQHPHTFRPMSWLNGWMDQDATWYEVDLGPGHIVLYGDPAPLKWASAPPHFSAHVYCVLYCGQSTQYSHLVLPCDFYLLLLSCFSSPNLSGRRLDVYHTFTHDVALARI